MNMIAFEIELALERAGFRQPKVRTVLSPAWTTDWMSEEGRRKLHAYGIAPPQASSSRRALFGEQALRARNAALTRPSCCPNSARPPARRCGAARPAANPSIISSVIDHVRSRTALPSPGRQRPPPRGGRRRIDDLCGPDELAGDYAFAPGQYLTLRTMLDGEEVRRSYSICSGPDDGEIRIAVKKVDGGAFSNWAADELKCGDELDVMTPTGRFGVRPPADGAHPCRLCRGLRHHADPVDRQGRACARAGQPLLPVLRQPHHRQHHVPARRSRSSRTASSIASRSSTSSPARSRTSRSCMAGSTATR